MSFISQKSRGASAEASRRDGPALYDLDFTGGTLPAGVIFKRASGNDAYVGSAGALGIVSAADTPAFDFDYVGGVWVPRGLILRPLGRRNLVPNSLFTGAVAGSSANNTAPGTLPSGAVYSKSGAGVTVALSYPTVDGIRICRMALSGTATATNTILLDFCGATGFQIVKRPADTDDDETSPVPPEALAGVYPGDVIAMGLRVRLSAGSLAGVTVELRETERTDVGGQPGGAAKFVVPNGDPLGAKGQYFELTRTLPVTAWDTVRAGVRVICAVGAVAATLDFALPEVQVGGSIVGGIPTSGTPAGRAPASATAAIPDGLYDVLVESGTSPAIREGVVVTGGIWPIVPNGGERRVSRVRFWRARAVSESFKRSVVGATVPSPLLRLLAAGALTLDGNGRLASAVTGTGTTVDQTDPAARPLLVSTPAGPALRFAGTEWLRLVGLPALGDDFSVAVVARSTSTARQTLFGQENTSSAAQLEINGYQANTAAAIVNGTYVAVSVPVPPFLETFFLSYSRRASDESGHAFTFNDQQNLPRLTASNITPARSFTGNGATKTFGRRAAASQPFIGDLYSLELYA